MLNECQNTLIRREIGMRKQKNYLPYFQIFASASRAFSGDCKIFADLRSQLYCAVCSGCQAVALFPLSIRSKSVVSPSRRPWPDADRARGENIRNIWTISGETRYYNIDLNVTPILEEGVRLEKSGLPFFLIPDSCYHDQLNKLLE